MKVLIACEFSGIVREAFKKLGHDAWSCDLLDTEIPGNHIQGDVLKILDNEWDLMIAHPPCTYLTISQAWTYKRPDKFPDRKQKQINAVDFFEKLLNADIEKICIENPVPMRILTDRVGKYSQIIHPWQYGHDASKKTCVWLKNLPMLKPTKIIIKDRYENQTKSGQNKCPPSKDRWKIRSKTYQGIADAMAIQWGK